MNKGFMVLTSLFICLTLTGLVASAGANELTLSKEYIETLNNYASASVRYFTSNQSNNIETGFTHSFYGTGKFQVYKNGRWCEEGQNITRGYGSAVNMNEVTLRFLSLAVAYKMNWLTFLPEEERYNNSWGQILNGLRTMRAMQISGDNSQFYRGHFHRIYETVICNNGIDRDRNVSQIACPPGLDIQSSDDNALPFLNLLLLEGLANDKSVDIPDSFIIIQLCQEIRADIELKEFILNDSIIHNFENGKPSTGKWDRISAEGPLILAAVLLSGQITVEDFYNITTSLEKKPVQWISYGKGSIEIDKPSYHSAMFIHGLRSIHGMPTTKEELQDLDFFTTSVKPVFESQIDYAEHYGLKALGSQVMSQPLYGSSLVEMECAQVQFPGNEDNRMPVRNNSLSRATGPHAWFIPLSRWRCLDQDDISMIFLWAAEYEDNFFHNGSDINKELGWEAAIPWTPQDTTFAWMASDGSWRYTDWGRPYEALNTAYIVLNIFDALNPDFPLASYNVEDARVKYIARYFDSDIPLPKEMFTSCRDY